jgi:Rap1a immunity proteins
MLQACSRIIALSAVFASLTMAQAADAANPEATNLSDQLVFLSGNDLHSLCQGNKAIAQGYTAGLWDGTVRSVFVVDTTFRGMALDQTVDFGLERLGGFCAPRGGVTVEQVTDVFCLYLRDTPETRDSHAALIFSEAMKKKWPCRKQ